MWAEETEFGAKAVGFELRADSTSHYTISERSVKGLGFRV